MINKIKLTSFWTNLSWIFVGNIAHAVFSFLINIIIVRSLSTSDNGILNYATSWISFYNALASFGINSVINKFTTHDNEESNKYISSAILFRVICGIIGIVLVVATVAVINTDEKSVLYISAIQSLSILFSCGDTIVFWLRYKKEARQAAIFRLVAFTISAILKLVCILVLGSLYLYVFATVLETLFFSLLLIYDYRRRYTSKIIFLPEKIKNIIKSSYPFMFSAALATIYAQTDRVMIKNMLGNDEVAYYSVAATLAGLMSVLATAIIEGFRPEIIENKLSGNIGQYKRRLGQVYGIIFWICVLYGCFCTLFSKQIILITYGEKYLPSHSALSLIVWYTIFSYFGTINNIFMVAESQEKWVQATTLIGASANIVLNYFLIPLWGINGAAAASLVTQIIANFITPLFIPKLRPIIDYIIMGITLKPILCNDFITKVRQIVKK